MYKIGNLIDLTGQRFGRLIVIERDKNKKNTSHTYWMCKCDCGNIKSINSDSLRNGKTQSCGCLNKEIISQSKIITDMIGKKFGKLTVIKRSETYITPSRQKKVRWLCKCDCGKETIVSSQDLKKRHTKSCGCINKKSIGDGLIDLIGKRFGNLVVIKRVEDYVYNSCGKEIRSPKWLCQCDCGNNVVVQGGNLRSGNTTNCGCKKVCSKGEQIVAEFLLKNNIKFAREYYFDDLRNKRNNFLRFDFAILDNEDKVIMLIEYQGEQHYIDTINFGKYQREYSDPLKREYCKKNNIFLYEIRFDDDFKKVFEFLLKKIK